MTEVCETWLARDFLARHSRPVDIPPCTCPQCPPIEEHEMTTTPAPTDLDTAVDAAARAIQAYQARTAFPPEQYTWDAIPQEWRDRHLAAARVMVEAAMTPLPAVKRNEARLADATILLVEAVQHGSLPTVLRQRINGYLAEANPATTAEPADDELVPHVEPVSAATIAGMAAMSQVRNREVYVPWDDEPAAS